MAHHFVLADCNNFYVSCERLFNPKIEKCPVIVLSNNDGCVVSRSQEAKRLGIKMGEPYFKIKDFCKVHKVVVHSSNYELYGDLSKRVMSILSEMADRIELYSIDEAFLRYSDHISPQDLYAKCLEIRRIIKKWVGIPLSLGIAPTKTLAKIATDLAKKTCDAGVFDLYAADIKKVLETYPVGDIWGIGHRLSESLYRLDIRTAWELREMDPNMIRRKMGVNMERIIWELRGVRCLELEAVLPRKNITCSRSFGEIIKEEEVLAEALSSFVNSACIRLREQGSCTQAICVFTESVFDRLTGTRRHNSTVSRFAVATNDTPKIISEAKKCLKQLYKEGEEYKKCGVVLLDLIPEASVVPDLFLGGIDRERSRLMHLVDGINAHFGKNTLFYGAMGVDGAWRGASDKRSSYNTTSWKHLPVARAV